MNEHLSASEIEQYVMRSGGVDDIITIGEHLDACDECRDRAARIVDANEELSGRIDLDLLRESKRALSWPAVVICVAVVIAISALIVVVLQ